MRTPTSLPCLRGYRFPHKILSLAFWTYHRFALIAGDVKYLLAVRSVLVRREAIRLWGNPFGVHFAKCIHRDRPVTADKRHISEMVFPINGEEHWL